MADLTALTAVRTKKYDMLNITLFGEIQVKFKETPAF